MATVKIVKVPVPLRSPSPGGVKRSPTSHRARIKFDSQAEEVRFQPPSPLSALLLEPAKSASKLAEVPGEEPWSSGADDAALAKPVAFKARRAGRTRGKNAKKGKGKWKQGHFLGADRKVQLMPGKDASKGGGGKHGRQA